MGFSAEEILKKQAPEAVVPEYTIDESLKTVKKVKRGQTVTVYTYKYEYQVHKLQKPYTGVVTKVYEEYKSGDYRTMVDVRQDHQTRTYNIDNENVIFKLVSDTPKYKKPKINVETFKKTTKPKSHYIVTLDIDQRDADCITVSSYQEGNITLEELIKLTILAHYRDLADYDYEWYNLGALNDYIEQLLSGNFYDQCNRFKIDGVTITGYDAKKNEFYNIPLPSLKSLGIEDINAAYDEYFSTSDDDDNDD